MLVIMLPLSRACKLSMWEVKVELEVGVSVDVW